ncbi:hypothetical protein M514_05613 [Trichuris suis]|uniref:Uncharacterized protein n=1 Tax=Trichuris suis TaxID=68888 RepID=A0A085NQS6_9BILA|nr:hypothetical protein M513_05613 [Trichuris suis]KFD71822.1 hypothetical protein M514_05613 [Trichuris suis]
MLFVCPCLNVSVEAILDRPFEETLVDIEYRSGDNENERRFARLVIRSGTAPSARLPGFISTERLDSWILCRCQLCGTGCYASSLDHPNELLVGTEMLHDESAITALQQSENYSEIYKVLLPPVSAEQQSLGSNFLDDYSFVTNGNSNVTYVHNVASNYLTRERDEMEERIRRFIDEENVRFDEKRVRAKSQRALLLQYLAAVGTNMSVEEKRDEGEEEDCDSAIPPSPLSLSSTGPSPMSRKAPKAGANNSASAGNDSSNSSGAVQADSDLYADGNRTKPKRVRHSGGTGKAPKLVSQVDDSQGILFLMDDCDIISAEPQISFDDDGDIDGASTTSEDAVNDRGPLYQTSALNGSSVGAYSSYSPSRGCKALGTSLPVTIPGVTCRTRPLDGSDTDDERSMYDLAASIHMLALTIQEADDPERLFGERPRRRYRRHNRDYENGI